MISQFEQDVANFCFQDASGLIMDAGCGNGNLIMRALPSFREARYIGLDFSRNMVNRAASRARDERNVSFFQGCVSHLPFEDETFDRVVSSGVLTCLPTVQDADAALKEFYRVLKPGGILVVDFFNQLSHFTLIRKHLLREHINPPEYISPLAFKVGLEEAGFDVQTFRGFDFKPYQGYLFLSRFRPLVDPLFIQERLSRLLEARIVPKVPGLGLLGYRIYVRCVKRWPIR